MGMNMAGAWPVEKGLLSAEKHTVQRDLLRQKRRTGAKNTAAVAQVTDPSIS
jgi:hypothetical protein